MPQEWVPKSNEEKGENTTDKRPSKRKALIISVSEYDNEEKLGKLEFCKTDGEKMYELLKSLRFEISDNHRLIGHVKFDRMRDAIYDFFDNAHIIADDMLLFYYSGHGIPISDGNMCFASSEIDPNSPRRRGFPSSELTSLIQESNSIRIVEILDCCHSGANRLPTGPNISPDVWIAMGPEDAAAKLGKDAIEKNAQMLKQQGEGKYLLGASQAAEEAFGSIEKGHSIFTFYLLEGLNRNKKSIDPEGKVTPYTLGNYIYREILNLPEKKRPKQKPVIKADVSGDIILAYYPELVERDPPAEPTMPSYASVDISSIIDEGLRHLQEEDDYRAIASFDKAISINPKNPIAYNHKGDVLFKQEKYEEAVKYYDKAISINPKNPIAYNHKGDVFFKLEKYDKALECYDKALEIDPNYFDVWKDEGLALDRLGKDDEAIKCFDEALKIKPNDNKVSKYREFVISKRSMTMSSKEDRQVINSSKLQDYQWENIIRRIRDQFCVPFIGPGAYVFQYKDGKVSLSPSRIIAQKWMMEYDYPVGEESNIDPSDLLSKVAQFLAIKNRDNMYPKRDLSWELSRINPPNFSLEEFKNTPYAVLSNLDLPVYITTNYDHFMEEALKSRGKNPVSEFCRWNEGLLKYTEEVGIPSVFDKNNKYEPTTPYEPTPAEPLVYHLFGTMDIPQSMVLTESDYKDFMTNLNQFDVETLPVVIRRGLAHSSLLFLGYNLQDINFRAINDGLLSKRVTVIQRPSRPSNLVVQLPPQLLKYDEKAKVMNYLESHAKNVFHMDLYWGNLWEFIRELRQNLDKFKE